MRTFKMILVSDTLLTDEDVTEITSLPFDDMLISQLNGTQCVITGETESLSSIMRYVVEAIQNFDNFMGISVTIGEENVYH